MKNFILHDLGYYFSSALMYVVMAVYVWNGVLPQEMTWLNSEQFNTLRFMAGGYLIGYFAAWAMHILETKR